MTDSGGRRGPDRHKVGSADSLRGIAGRPLSEWTRRSKEIARRRREIVRSLPPRGSVERHYAMEQLVWWLDRRTDLIEMMWTVGLVTDTPP